MGLLDEAIRDHLDLKRRRGADPADVERAEREALGPVRRDPFEHGPDDVEPASMPDDRPRAYDHEEELYDDEGYEGHRVEGEWDEEFEGQPHEARFDPEGFSEEEPSQPADSTTLMDHESMEGPDAQTSAEYLQEPQAPLSHEPSAPYPTEAGAGDETMQYDVEEALAAEQPRPEAEPSPEWVEQSDEWVEQSEEWIEPSHRPLEDPHDTAQQPHEPPESTRDQAEHGAPPTEPRPPYPDPAEHEVGPEEAPPHREPPPPSHNPEAEGQVKAERDVLDETPDFLHDEPDHDQLWFEQRPPRDFDFDG